MAEIVQRMSEMEGGQWGEGEQRGRLFAKYKIQKQMTKVQNIFLTNNKKT